MSKEYNLFCTKHGRIEIKVENPSLKFDAAPACPFCSNRLMILDKDNVKKWQPNYVSEGARACLIPGTLS